MDWLKKVLEEMGLPTEQVEKIISSVKGKHEPLQEEISQYKKQIADLNKNLVLLQEKSKDNEEVNKKLQELQAEIKTKEGDIAKVKKDSALQIALTEAKAKNIKAVKALLDFESLELDEDGSIKGLKEQISKLQESDSFLFEQEREQEETQTTGGLGNFGRKTNETKEESLGERLAKQSQVSQVENPYFK